MPLRVVGFAVALVVLFAGAAIAGRAVDIAPRSAGEAGETASHGAGAAAGTEPVGLSLSEGGLVLAPLGRTLPAGAPSQLRFRVLDGNGQPVRSFDLEHERRMHVIVVRRDLTGFQHLHPVMAADGTWTVPVRIEEPGPYRLLADFSSGGERRVLGVDLAAAGAYAPRPLPAPAATAPVDGYTVALRRDSTAAGAVTFTFRVERGGRLVTPGHYLGALGHLVVLREGDLAFVHAHPDEEAAGPDVTFSSALPSAGRYRLFLQFAHGGSVHTASFTVEAGP